MRLRSAVLAATLFASCVHLPQSNEGQFEEEQVKEYLEQARIMLEYLLKGLDSCDPTGKESFECTLADRTRGEIPCTLVDERDHDDPWVVDLRPQRSFECTAGEFSFGVIADGLMDGSTPPVVTYHDNRTFDGETRFEVDRPYSLPNACVTIFDFSNGQYRVFNGCTAQTIRKAERVNMLTERFLNRLQELLREG